MKIAVLTQTHNDAHVGVDGKSNIQRLMDSIVGHCDSAVVFDNGSTDETYETIIQYSEDIEIEVPRNLAFESGQDNYHIARSLEHCRRLDADWILLLKCNEYLVDGVQFRLFCRYCPPHIESADISGERRLFRLTDDLRYDIEEGYFTPLKTKSHIDLTNIIKIGGI